MSEIFNDGDATEHIACIPTALSRNIISELTAIEEECNTTFTEEVAEIKWVELMDWAEELINYDSKRNGDLLLETVLTTVTSFSTTCPFLIKAKERVTYDLQSAGVYEQDFIPQDEIREYIWKEEEEKKKKLAENKPAPEYITADTDEEEIEPEDTRIIEPFILSKVPSLYATLNS